MDIFFAFLAGLLTLVNPCILPIVPIVLASATNSNRHGPLAIAIGLSSSFVFFGVVIATIGNNIGLAEGDLSKAGSLLMVFFGLTILVPKFSNHFSTFTSRLSHSASVKMGGFFGSSLKSQFLGGVLLGGVWSPCIGPTLGGAISLASQGDGVIWASLVMLSFSIGVSCVIVFLGYGAGSVIRRRRIKLESISSNSKPTIGFAFVLVGLVVFFEMHYIVEALVIEIMPVWLQDLSVKF